jgi:symplekin
LTENSFKLLKSFCQDELRFYFSLNTLFDLIKSRISQRSLLLNLLLELTHEKNESIRAHTITLALKLYRLNEFRDSIEKYSIDRLKNLVHPNPPLSLFADSSDDQVKELETIQWNEESIKSCLYLFLDLMPANHHLIHS